MVATIDAAAGGLKRELGSSCILVVASAVCNGVKLNMQGIYRPSPLPRCALLPVQQLPAFRLSAQASVLQVLLVSLGKLQAL